MSDLFTLSGGYCVEPLAAPSGDPSIDAPLFEKVALIAKQYNTLVLGVDGDIDVAFSDITQAHVLVVKAVGGRVDVKMTTSEGVLQVIPVDSILIWNCMSAPITALKVSRPPAVPVTAKVFLGQNS